MTFQSKLSEIRAGQMVWTFEIIVRTSRKDSGIRTIDGTAQKIAREIREPTPTVRQALRYLESNTTENVQSAIVDGRRHWMRGL